MHQSIPVPPEGAAVRQLADGRPDLLVREEPLLLDVHGQTLVTMRTPGADEDLALGFLLGEGLITSAAEVTGMQFTPGEPERRTADTLVITLQGAPSAQLRQRLARTHEIRSSCGVCGLADVATMLDDLPPLLPGVPRVPAARIGTLLTRLAERQELFSLTGGCHGALLAPADGDGPLFAAEDVGRHNALDKAIGAAARAGVDFSRTVAVLSGRAGYDLVVKCLRVRIPVIASVSAPSALAFDLCHAAGATLLGFVRGDRHQVYCGPERLLP